MQQQEVSNLVDVLRRDLIGARLQKCICYGEEIFEFEFWRQGQTSFLLVDFSKSAPVALWRLASLKRSVQKKPLQLFISAHLVGKFVNAIIPQFEFGRVFALDFGEEFQIEFRVFAKGKNILVRAGPKKIALHKPTALVGVGATSNAAGSLDVQNHIKTMQELEYEYLNATTMTKAKNKIGAPKNIKLELEKQIEKKNRALQKMREAKTHRDSSNRIEFLMRAGEFLKAEQSLQNIPEELKEFINTRMSISQNIEAIFAEIKKEKTNATIQVQRIQKAQEEVNALTREQGEVSGSEATLENPKSEAIGVVAASIRFEYGKNAIENLKLLRKAKPWDLWLHLVDYPGCHGILHRNKNEKVSDEQIRDFGQIIVEQTFRKKISSQIGLNFKLAVAECRFVNPIKGDRLGRVTFRNVRTLTFVVRSKT